MKLPYNIEITISKKHEFLLKNLFLVKNYDTITKIFDEKHAFGTKLLEIVKKSCYSKVVS